MTAMIDADRTLDPAVRRLVDALLAEGLDWLVLRGRAQLPSPGHDVDLLVAREDLARAEDVIFSLGGVALPRRVHPWHRMYLLDREGAPRLLVDVITEITYNRQLRLTTDLADVLLERRVWDGTVPVPDDSDLFWTVLLHCLLDKQAFSPSRRGELLGALPGLRAGSPGERFYAGLGLGSPSPEQLVALVRAEFWDELARLGTAMVARLRDRRGIVPVQRTPAGGNGAGAAPGPRGVRQRLRGAAANAYPYVWRRLGLGATPHAPVAVKDAQVDARVAEVVRRPLLCTVALDADPEDAPKVDKALRSRRFLPVGDGWYRVGSTGLERAVLRPAEPAGPARRRAARPLMVSFSGLDGAGKTHQIDALVSTLSERYAVALRWLPFKIWPEDLLNKLPASFRSRLGPSRKVATDAGPAPAPAAESGPRKSPALRRAYWRGVSTLSAVSGGLSLRWRSQPEDTDVLVMDRYRLDALVKLLFWYPEVPPRWLARVVCALTPPPDLEVFLRIAPEVAYARKAEQWSVSQLARQARAYEWLADNLPDVLVVDAEEHPDRIAAMVRARVERLLDER